MKFVGLLLLILAQLHALQTGTTLPRLTLAHDEGGSVDGTAFDSDALRGKVHIIFYVDPDEKDTNNLLSDTLKAQNFDRSRLASVAIINMEATWLPNFAIASSLKQKQEQFPDTLYVKDMVKKGVAAWEISDDNSDVILVDGSGKVLYIYEGRVPESEFDTIITLIKEHM